MTGLAQLGGLGRQEKQVSRQTLRQRVIHTLEMILDDLTEEIIIISKADVINVGAIIQGKQTIWFCFKKTGPFNRKGNTQVKATTLIWVVKLTMFRKEGQKVLMSKQKAGQEVCLKPGKKQGCFHSIYDYMKYTQDPLQQKLSFVFLICSCSIFLIIDNIYKKLTM